MKIFYVSPNGTGDGSENDPADYHSNIFWQRVREAIVSDSVTVYFLDGKYRAEIPPLEIGHPDHSLFLQGISSGAVFVIPDDETSQDTIPCTSKERKLWPDRIFLSKSENVRIRQLHFTGNGSIGYVIRCRSGSHNISIEDCTFINLPGVVYGATGASDSGTHHITLRNCHFRSIGCDPHAHMMYNAYDAERIFIKDCHFEECAGDYVRFRDRVDHCVVRGCVFKSTGARYSDPRPFIAIPVFNDVDPGNEYFGTHFIFADNQFIYETTGSKRFAIAIHHSGWDPPGRYHLLTSDEGEILRNGSFESRKQLLERNCGIDTDQIIVYGNLFQGVRFVAAFESVAAYEGVTSERWNAWNRWEATGESAVDISDLLKLDTARRPAEWLEPVLNVILEE